MKRTFSLILALAMFALTVFGASAASVDLADESKTVLQMDDWMYEKINNDTQWELDEYIGDGGEIYAPRVVANLLVVQIGDYCFANNSNVTSVVTSSPLWIVGEYAFANCTSLESFECNYALNAIKTGAFSGAASLKSINLETAKLTEIAPYTFLNSGIEEVQLPDTCTEISDYAFAQCYDLSKITIPTSVTTIADTAFSRDEDVTIYCYTDSYAHSYAVDNELPFVLIDGQPDESLFATHSISLNGDIGVNFYVNVPDEDVNAGKVKVDFAWTVEGEPMTHSVTLTSLDKYSYGYKATCPVAVAEMTCEVEATVSIDGVVQGPSDVYSVQEYAIAVLSDANNFRSRYIAAENRAGRNGEQRYNDLIALIKAMLDYGTKAQIAFDRDVQHPVNGGTDFYNDTNFPVTSGTIPVTEENLDMDLSDYGLRYKGNTIVFLSETSIRIYYYVDDWDLFDTVRDNVYFDGKKVEYVEKDGAIYFEKRGVGSANIDTPYTLSINGRSCKYSVNDYCRRCLLSDKVTAKAKALAKATYRYNVKANTYFDI